MRRQGYDQYDDCIARTNDATNYEVIYLITKPFFEKHGYINIIDDPQTQNSNEKSPLARTDKRAFFKR